MGILVCRVCEIASSRMAMSKNGVCVEEAKHVGPFVPMKNTIMSRTHEWNQQDIWMWLLPALK